ncbi:hypothetical protein Ddye_021820 [Dipteronia dyeriana]|uniref:Major facilitator superfamily (MFS) profile domain-containing protein n=1 Tax=Dipteronia dyeriana TaxID=168575 RepID=A0AAD9U2D5_9ROSI|nr:hypothetical protein Ddye_021820 [Dipteronia dyeriana]
MLQPQEAQILAPGLNFFPTLKPPNKTLSFHRISALVITFFAYASFHASRKPSSIVKSVLGPSKSAQGSLEETGWVPFNGPDGTHRLVVRPEDLGFEAPAKEVEMHVEKAENEDVGLLGVESSDSLKAIGFLQAWRLPGVAPFSFCLFFSKLVAYTFLYWLPFYLRHTGVAGKQLTHKTAGILSIIFDFGGVLGGILAGLISDLIEARAVTSVAFLLLSIPSLILYRAYGSLSMVSNIALMFLSGLLVNAPYSLITTAVAADLGTQDSIKGNSRALATVTAIIDGTGSVGAALGPLLAGYISTRGWNSVFLMLIVSILLAALLLICVAKTEIRQKLNKGKWVWNSSQ